jgi:ABC-type multidrug transport system fused ATPase/permease subunit
MRTASPLTRLLRYSLAQRRLLKGALGLLLIATVADVSGPLLIKVFIDDYLQPGQWPWQPLAGLACAYIALMLIAAAANYFQALRLHILAVRVVQQMREDVFARVIRLPLSYFDRTPTGSLISRITNDTETVKELYVSVIGTFVQNIVRIIGIFIAMAVLDVRLMAACLVFLPIMAGLMWWYQRISTPLFQRARTLLSDINASLHESLQGIAIIQLFNQQWHFQQHFRGTAQSHFRARLRNLKLDALMLRPLVDLLHMAVLATLLYLFGSRSFASPVEVGVIYAFISYLGRFIEPLIEMTQRLNLFQQALVAGQRVFELIDMPAIAYPERADAVITQGAVTFKEVSFSYDGKQPVINSLSFRVPPGGFYAVVGHTGSGKSTLANLLLRFYDPQQGVICIDDNPLGQIPEAALRQHMAIVQQDPFIFSDSIASNIAMGLPLSPEEIHTAARKARLHDFIASLPQGYDTVLDERGSNLSSGQRQLLSLARILARQPKILLLDEATANIDSRTEARIQEALSSLHGQVTLIVIAHRLSTIRHADQILVLHQGQLVQQGTHQQLLQQQGLYQHLHQLQELPAPA